MKLKFKEVNVDAHLVEDSLLEHVKEISTAVLIEILYRKYLIKKDLPFNTMRDDNYWYRYVPYMGRVNLSRLTGEDAEFLDALDLMDYHAKSSTVK